MSGVIPGADVKRALVRRERDTECASLAEIRVTGVALQQRQVPRGVDAEQALVRSAAVAMGCISEVTFPSQRTLMYQGDVNSRASPPCDS